MMDSRGHEEWCLRGKCLSGVPTSSLWPRVYSAGTTSALCSFLKWAELHRRTPLSNHPLLLSRTICSGRHRRERQMLFLNLAKYSMINLAPKCYFSSGGD